VSIPVFLIVTPRSFSTELFVFYYHIYLYYDHNLQESAVCA